MATLTASRARILVNQYNRSLENFIFEAQKNFEDMDFENCNRREQVEELIAELKRDCEHITSSLLSLYFEE